MKIGFFVVVDFDIPRIIKIFRLEKSQFLRIIGSKNFQIRKFFDRMRQKVQGICDISKAFNDIISKIYNLKTSSNNFPTAKELDLKKAAKVVGEKSIEMIKSKELLPLTGYIHGGCSPIGMKKYFQTTIHQSAKDLKTIFFSGGKVGYQVELSPLDLEKIIKIEYKDII